jgi:hypothetical protein
MAHILRRHRPQDLVFIDGWTGKGTIQRELARSLACDLPVLREAPLCVVADLAGVADVAASADDYVIPSAILNGIISGLVSRSVLHADHIGPGDFHGCVLLDHLAGWDLSRWYIEAQMQDVYAALADPALPPLDWNENRRRETARISSEFVHALMGRFAIRDRNQIKPGIGEATRALLRRVPDRLFVREYDSDDVRHLLALASAREIVVEVEADLLYRACAVIKTLGEE